MSIEQRIYDALHERRIKRLSVDLVTAMLAHERITARRIDAERMAAIRSRSQGQIARITARLHAKLGIK